MADWQAIAKHAAGLLEQKGLTVHGTWKGKAFHGVKSLLRRLDIETAAGLFEGRYEFSLLCPASCFADGVPSPRTDKVRVGGVQYRVLSLETDAANATIRLNLGDVLQ